MQRSNVGINVNEFAGVTMENQNHVMDYEGGEASLSTNIQTPEPSLKQEVEKAKAVLDTIKLKGLSGYWQLQTTASKVTHGLIAALGAIISLNFLFAMYSHFNWEKSLLGHHLQDDEVLILYCQTQGCGCENGVLRKLQKMIHEHLADDEGPEMKIYTQLYPGAPLTQFFARFFQMIQVLLILCIFFGPMLCRKIYGYGADVVDKAMVRYPWIVQKLSVGGCFKKVGMFLVVFIGFNIVVALLTISGAFEIYHGGDHVFSSLESKRMVTPRDLVDIWNRVDGKESPLLTKYPKALDTPVGHMH